MSHHRKMKIKMSLNMHIISIHVKLTLGYIFLLPALQRPNEMCIQGNPYKGQLHTSAVCVAPCMVCRIFQERTKVERICNKTSSKTEMFSPVAKTLATTRQAPDALETILSARQTFRQEQIKTYIRTGQSMIV